MGNRNYYTKDMDGCAVDQQVLQALVKQHAPSLFKRSTPDNDIAYEFTVAIQMDALQWLLCLFIHSLPFEAVLRVWDLYFLQGTVLLLRLAVTVVKRCEEQLLACSDMAAFLEVLRKRLKKYVEVDILLLQTFDAPAKHLDRKALEKQREAVRATQRRAKR
eukprot:NODE_2027_length_696_cov_8.443586_g1714_i0.p4 GENE.NODE_2027_length_696_cov_8.443586_g1714_i0~~NODE_2027_length_696_cov_8.443586_g1714_i0.p4  ORF type:complete len:161 (+),score=81.21 NODE_2027_length_696_cov_8.443586_g1714_i0:34-516(+)